MSHSCAQNDHGTEITREPTTRRLSVRSGRTCASGTAARVAGKLAMAASELFWRREKSGHGSSSSKAISTPSIMISGTQPARAAS